MDPKTPSASSTQVMVAAVAVAIVAAYVCLWNLHEPSIRPGDEALHVTVTQGMLHRGLEFVPQNEGKPYYNKPPLKMWLSLIPLSVFGESNVTYRLLDGLAGVGTTLLTFALGLMIFRSVMVGMFSAMLLLGCRAYIFEHTVRTAVQDSMLVFLTTATVLVAWRALGSVDRAPGIRSAIACGILVGAGVLVKHVAGFMPLFVIGFYLLSIEGMRVIMNRWLWTASAVALMVAGAYYLPLFLWEPAAWRTLIGVEVVERARDGFHNSSKSWFYLQQLIINKAAVPPLLLAFSLGLGAYRFWRTRSRGLLFVMVAASIPVILYSVPPSRLIWYIAPAFPAMSLLCAWGLTEAGRAAVHQLPYWRRALAGIVFSCGIVMTLQQLWFVTSRVQSGADRIEFDWLTAALLKQTPPSAIRQDVIYFRGFPPGPFERVYLRMLARGKGIRERNLAPLRERIERATVRFVITPLRFFDDVVSLGGVVGYRFIRPSKPVPRWMLRQEWYVVLAYDGADLITALTPATRILGLQQVLDHWEGTIQGDHATDSLGAEIEIPGCRPEQLTVKLNGFDAAVESWINGALVQIGAGILRPGANAVTIGGDCARDLSSIVQFRSIPLDRET